jgi:tetratricopeptide (TPR) repeat protein
MSEKTAIDVGLVVMAIVTIGVGLVVMLARLPFSNDTSPTSSADFRSRGLKYYRDEDYHKAISDFTEALRLDPKSGETYSLRGDAYYDMKKYDKAIEDYTQAIDLDCKSADVFNSRSVAYYDKKEYDKAIKDYTQAIEIDTNCPQAYNNFAWILATCPDDSIRDGTKAIELATRACDLSKWKNYHTLDTLAAAYAEMGNFEEALKWQNKLFELVGGGKELNKDLARRLRLYEEGKPCREE